jgi:hypothetical protein
MFRIPTQSIFTCHSTILSSCIFLFRRSVQIFFLSVFLSVNLQFPLSIICFSHVNFCVSCIPCTVTPLSFYVTCYFKVSKMWNFFPIYVSVFLLSLPLHLSMKAAESHTNEARLGYYICTVPTELKPIYHTQAGNICDIVFRPVPFEETLRFEDRIYIYIYIYPPSRISIWLPALHGELSPSCKCSVRIGMSFAAIRTGSSLAIIISVGYRVCCSVQLPTMCNVKNSWHSVNHIWGGKTFTCNSMFNMLPLVSRDFGATVYYCNKVFLLFPVCNNKTF